MMNGRETHLEVRALTNATSGGTGVFIATFTAGELPIPAFVASVGSAFNLNDSFSGYCVVGTAYTDALRIAKYDGTAIASNSKYFYANINYQV
jgi:hypothetical protein